MRRNTTSDITTITNLDSSSFSSKSSLITTTTTTMTTSIPLISVSSLITLSIKKLTIILATCCIISTTTTLGFIVPGGGGKRQSPPSTTTTTYGNVAITTPTLLKIKHILQRKNYDSRHNHVTMKRSQEGRLFLSSNDDVNHPLNQDDRKQHDDENTIRNDDDDDDTIITPSSSINRAFQRVSSSLKENSSPPPSSSSSFATITSPPLFISSNNNDDTPSSPSSNNELNKSINLEIVKWGHRLPPLSSPQKKELSSSPPTRVPGCVSTVTIQITLHPLSSVDDDDDDITRRYGVTLEGTSDAMIGRGLLSLLSTVFAGGHVDDDDEDDAVVITARDILSVDPNDVAELLGLRTVLSVGRNDGLASVMRVAQDLIRHLLIGSKTTPVATDPPPLILLETTSSSSSQDERPKKTVAMLLSGGVDSSVALHLLLQNTNYSITAFYLKIWLEDELSHLGTCPWEDDYATCVAVCAAANVPFETISLQKEYRERVMEYTLREARCGRTPNPDVMCNARVKFGVFREVMMGERGFDYLASGHYARVEMSEDGKAKLYRAPDDIKDQSYFLSTLSQSQLSSALFPLGNYTKKEVRALAEEFELVNRNRPDSQGLCFLGKIKFDDFLKAHLGDCPGDVLDANSGDVLGRHGGLWFHTVGQRRGMGKVLNARATSQGPWYVVAKDVERNVLLVSNEYEEGVFEKARREFEVEDVHWMGGGGVPLEAIGKCGTTSRSSWEANVRMFMKIRHGPRVVKGSLSLSNEDGTRGRIVLDDKDGGLAPGQFVAFYRMEKSGDDDDEERDSGECLGAGVISERHWATFLLENVEKKWEQQQRLPDGLANEIKDVVVSAE